MDAPLDSTAGRRSDFLTTQWGLVAASSAEEVAEARAALEELYRIQTSLSRRLAERQTMHLWLQSPRIEDEDDVKGSAITTRSLPC